MLHFYIVTLLYMYILFNWINVRLQSLNMYPRMIPLYANCSQIIQLYIKYK